MIGSRLKLLREELKLSQKELANKFDLSEARYNQYENNRRNPDYQILCNFAKFFKVSTDFLLGITTVRNIKPTQSLDGYTELTEDEIKKIEEYKEFILSKRKNKKN